MINVLAFYSSLSFWHWKFLDNIFYQQLQIYRSNMLNEFVSAFEWEKNQSCGTRKAKTAFLNCCTTPFAHSTNFVSIYVTIIGSNGISTTAIIVNTKSICVTLNVVHSPVTGSVYIHLYARIVLLRREKHCTWYATCKVQWYARFENKWNSQKVNVFDLCYCGLCVIVVVFDINWCDLNYFKKSSWVRGGMVVLIRYRLVLNIWATPPISVIYPAFHAL